MQTLSMTTGIDCICKSSDLEFSTIIYWHICLQDGTYAPAKGFGSDQLIIEQRVERKLPLMNNNNCNSASTACSTILDLHHYEKGKERYCAIK